MTLSRIACWLLGAALALATPEADPRYFTTVRDVRVNDAAHQNYVVLDAAIWKHARTDLADLRLYAGTIQVPYALREMRGGSSSEEHEVKVLNLASVGDHTEFDLDMEGVPEYDHIRLHLDAKNFVASAAVQGRDTLLGGIVAPWPEPSTLYDFSSEKLGSNFTIKLPTWSFRYVHVKLGRGITPREVKGASVFNLQERKSAYFPAGTCLPGTPKPRQTIFQCDVTERVPLDRIVFDVSPQSVNFRRAVSIHDEKDRQIGSGDITRIRARRGGQEITSEDFVVPACYSCGERFLIVIDNGDDAPLFINAVTPQAFQRRLYFDPAGRSSFKLYYGDTKLSPPVYDYAKFFKDPPDAVQAFLVPAIANPSYTARPDDRPWSERHKWLLWAAMLIAVAVLAWLAVKGLKEKVAGS